MSRIVKMNVEMVATNQKPDNPGQTLTCSLISDK